ncbi:Acyltransferase family protein [compost metagenome]
MGAIRLLLALAVVSVHIHWDSLWAGPGGTVAVQAFFMISGFYIAMTLSGPYAGAPFRFWLNRALRLYPAYLIAAAAGLMLNLLLAPEFSDAFASLPTGAKILLATSNAVIFGQDWVMFSGVRDGSLSLVSNFRDSDPELWSFLVDPPAWSLGVELTFYLLAPFLFRLKTSVIVALLLLSAALRLALVLHGLKADPWSYRFFPTELAMFLLGGLAHRAGVVINRSKRFARHGFLGGVALAGTLLFIMLYGAIPLGGTAKKIIFYATFAISLPFIFDYVKSNKIDRIIGDLSYPLYISHWPVLMAVRHWLGPIDTVPEALISVSACIAAAIGLCAAVDMPIQRLRASVRNVELGRVPETRRRLSAGLLPE